MYTEKIPFQPNIDQRYKIYRTLLETLKYSQKNQIFEYVGLCYHLNVILVQYNGYTDNLVYEDMSFLPELLAQKPKITHNDDYWFEFTEYATLLGANPRIEVVNKALQLIQDSLDDNN